MKSLPPLIALVGMLLLPGCGVESAAESENAVTIDCAIEVQIAVVSGLEAGYKMDDGDWQIAATCVFSVQSAGGPGHVVCNTDGTIMELQWNDVRMTHYGKRITFGGGQWWIRNRIERSDGVSHTVGGGVSNPPLSFGTDFDWLATCEIDTGLTERTGRRLVIRGRMLPKTPPVLPLILEERTGPGP